MIRLDKLLVQNGVFSSRERAQDAILQNTIKVEGKIINKPSKEVEENANIEVIDIFNKYVSRGGLKLEKAIEDFSLDFSDKIVLDIGSSTGGFTDCALKHGARHITAIDVGSNQLHPSLRNLSQIISIENKDFRELTPEDVSQQKYDFIVSDVSFISLTHLIPYFHLFLKPEGECMLLIKPQFEAGHSFLNKNGIVTDEKGYKIAIQRVVQEALIHGLYLHQISISTLFEKIKNIEFLAHFSHKDYRYQIDYHSLFKAVKALKKQVAAKK